jgi:hypothetical protein
VTTTKKPADSNHRRRFIAPYALRRFACIIARPRSIVSLRFRVPDLGFLHHTPCASSRVPRRQLSAVWLRRDAAVSGLCCAALLGPDRPDNTGVATAAASPPFPFQLFIYLHLPFLPSSTSLDSAYALDNSFCPSFARSSTAAPLLHSTAVQAWILRVRPPQPVESFTLSGITDLQPFQIPKHPFALRIRSTLRCCLQLTNFGCSQSGRARQYKASRRQVRQFTHIAHSSPST